MDLLASNITSGAGVCGAFYEGVSIIPCAAAIPIIEPGPSRFFLEKRPSVGETIITPWDTDTDQQFPGDGYMVVGPLRKALKVGNIEILQPLSADPTLPQSVRNSVVGISAALPVGAKAAVDLCYFPGLKVCFNQCVEQRLGPVIWANHDLACKATTATNIFLASMGPYIVGENGWVAEHHPWILEGLPRIWGEQVIRSLRLRDSNANPAERCKQERQNAFTALSPIRRFDWRHGPDPADRWDVAWVWRNYLSPFLVEQWLSDVNCDATALARRLVSESLVVCSLADKWSTRVGKIPEFCGGQGGDEERPLPEKSLPSDGDTLATLVVTEDTDGFLEHCGCAVNQSGGAAKRVAYVEAIRAQSKASIHIDLGRIFGRPEHGRADPVRSQLIRLVIDIYDLEKPDALVPDVIDFINGGDIFESWCESNDSYLISSNIAKRIGHKRVLKAYKGIRVDDRTIYIIGLSGHQWARAPYADMMARDWRARFTLIDDVEAITKALDEIKVVSNSEDIVLVAGQVQEATIEKIANSGLRIDGIITSCNHRFDKIPARGSNKKYRVRSTHHLRAMEGTGRSLSLIYAEFSSYGVLRFDLHKDGVASIPDAVPLDNDVRESPAARGLIDDFYEAHAGSAEWNPQPLFAHESSTGHPYVGSRTCYRS